MRALLSLFVAVAFATAAFGEGWTGFYEKEILARAKERMAPGIEENFTEVIWPKLTGPEKQALSGVKLEFPLENAQHPMNFYSWSDGRRKVVVLPISSLKFFSDLAVAYAWLDRNHYSHDPVIDYVAMIKYQWREGALAGKPFRPRDVLGIPEKAADEPAVENLFQRIFGTAVVFVLSHELGHLYYRHPLPNSEKLSDEEIAKLRDQEIEADRFALEIMRRIGDAPVGMVQFFSALAYLEPFSGDADYAERRRTNTHPVTAGRIQSIATALKEQATDFSRTGTNPTKFTYLAGEIATIAKFLDDEGVQRIFRQKGLTAQPELLGPRKPGERIATATQTDADSAAPFSGSYVGEWIDAKGIDFDVDMKLTRNGDRVTGSYSFGAYSQRAGNVSVEGNIKDDQLHYSWKWGHEYFGKGVLTLKNGELSGTWGYTKAESGAGTWKLRRHK